MHKFLNPETIVLCFFYFYKRRMWFVILFLDLVTRWILLECVHMFPWMWICNVILVIRWFVLYSDVASHLWMIPLNHHERAFHDPQVLLHLMCHIWSFSICMCNRIFSRPCTGSIFSWFWSSVLSQIISYVCFQTFISWCNIIVFISWGKSNPNRLFL